MISLTLQRTLLALTAILLLVVGANAQESKFNSVKFLLEEEEEANEEVKEQTASTIIISTATGQVQGDSYPVSPTNKNISRFLGIPYAEPPFHTLRWQDTIKKAPWHGVLPAHKFKGNCYQIDREAYSQPVFFSEDCLHLNIWTPKTADTQINEKYPVLLWFHGGDFTYGGSHDDIHYGDVLVSYQDVVVVTFNYRLDILGFFRLDTNEYTSNYALKDQRMALNWVRENIDNFGGDKDLITLVGADAGAESIGYLLMDNSLKDNFHRAIMMGGSPYEPQLVENNTNVVRSLNRALMRRLNCTDAETRTCLSKYSGQFLLDYATPFKTHPRLQLSPDIDGRTILKDPFEAFARGSFMPKDLLIGVTNNEGVKVGIRWLNQTDRNQSLSNEQLIGAVTRACRFYPKPMARLEYVGDNYLELVYTQRENPDDGERNFRIFQETFGDYRTLCPAIKTAKAVEKLNPKVFLYYFTEDEGSDVWKGSSHGEDHKYLFGYPLLSSKGYSSEQKNLSLKMMESFVSFASSGRPSLVGEEDEWKPLGFKDKGQINFYEFNSKNSRNFTYGFRLNQCHWWEETLAYVNSLEEPPRPTTPGTPGTTVSTQATTQQTSTEKPPIGPGDLRKLCQGVLNDVSAKILGVLLTLQVVTAVALVVLVVRVYCLRKPYRTDDFDMSKR